MSSLRPSFLIWRRRGGPRKPYAAEAYMEQVLAPKPGQVVVLDNLSAHTGERVRQAIQRQGCQVLWLPTYSPDLTPIEEAFSKLKTFLRRMGRARTTSYRRRLDGAWRRSRRRTQAAG